MCRRRGGLEEERAERQRWNEREQKKIMDSVQGSLRFAELVTLVLSVCVWVIALSNLRRRAIALKQQRMRMRGQECEATEVELGDEWEESQSDEEGGDSDISKESEEGAPDMPDTTLLDSGVTVEVVDTPPSPQREEAIIEEEAEPEAIPLLVPEFTTHESDLLMFGEEELEEEEEEVTPSHSFNDQPFLLEVSSSSRSKPLILQDSSVSESVIEETRLSEKQLPLEKPFRPMIEVIASSDNLDDQSSPERITEPTTNMTTPLLDEESDDTREVSSTILKKPRPLPSSVSRRAKIVRFCDSSSAVSSPGQQSDNQVSLLCPEGGQGEGEEEGVQSDVSVGGGGGSSDDELQWAITVSEELGEIKPQSVEEGDSEMVVEEIEDMQLDSLPKCVLVKSEPFTQSSCLKAVPFSQSQPLPVLLPESPPLLVSPASQCPVEELSEFKFSDVPLVDPDTIQQVDAALENIKGKSDAELTQEEKVWRLAACGGSSLVQEREDVVLDHETKSRLKHSLQEAGVLDKVSLKF